MVQSSSSQNHSIISCCSKYCAAPSTAKTYGVGSPRFAIASGKHDLIQASCPSRLTVRHGPASSPSATAVGVPWRRIPEPLRHPPASSVPLPVSVPADAPGSTQCAEPTLLLTPSTSAAFFPTCCTPFRLTGRPHPSASPRSPLPGTTAPGVHAVRRAYAHRRTDRSRSEDQTFRSCALRTGRGDCPGSCNGQRPQHRGPRYLFWPNRSRLQLFASRQERQGSPGVTQWRRQHNLCAGKSPEIREHLDQDPER